MSLLRIDYPCKITGSLSTTVLNSVKVLISLTFYTSHSEIILVEITHLPL